MKFVTLVFVLFSFSIALNPKLPPGGNFDLSIWSLQLPTGSGTSPTTIKPMQLAGESGYSDSNYFYTDKADGAITFMDPAMGITTSGSLHCRTELREMANWPATGTNTLTVTGELVQVGGGASGHVSVGQVFDYSTSKPLCELEYYNTGEFKVLLEKTSAGGSADFYSLGAQTIGNKYSFTLSLTGTTLTITVNGSTTTYTPDKSFTGAQFYFKCGAYDQTAIKGVPSITPYTVVKVYSLNVLHSAVVQIVRQNSARHYLQPTLTFIEANNSVAANNKGQTTLLDLRGRSIQTFTTSKRPSAIGQSAY